MQFGYFDDQQLEYVITRPDTPLPWINYLGTEAYFGIISNTAGGYSFYKDARLRRITRYRYNNAPLDVGGRYIYIRDDKEFWSPSWQPTRSTLEEYQCRHGLGYTIIQSQKNGIKSLTKYFVPIGQDIEVWDFEVTNQNDKRVTLDIFSAIEFCLWDAVDDSNNFQRNYSIGEVEVEENVIYHKTEYRERRNHFAFFACSHSLTGFETQREEFLGPYQGWDNPYGVVEGKTHNSIAHGWQPIGVHHFKINLDPGESRRIIFLLGYYENPKDEKFDPPGSQTLNKTYVKPIIQELLNEESVDVAFRDLKDYWQTLLNKFCCGYT